MLIRHESPADIEAIRSLNYAAFKNHPHHEPGAEPTEHLIVDNLREAGALTLSMVTEKDGEVVGHVAISPVTIGGDECFWFGFKQTENIALPGIPAEYFMGLPLSDSNPSGDVAYHPAFS